MINTIILSQKLKNVAFGFAETLEEGSLRQSLKSSRSNCLKIDYIVLIFNENQGYKR